MTSGIHHVTAITRDVQANVDFWMGFLGLSLVKQTAGFEDAGQLHLFYGDPAGAPGTLISFLVWQDGAPGRVGHGRVAEIALAVPRARIGDWLTRAMQRGLRIEGPVREWAEPVLRLKDPDGIIVKLVGTDAADTGWPAAPSRIRAVTIWSAVPEQTAAFLRPFGYRAGPARGGLARLLSDTDAIDIRDASGFVPGSPGTGTIDHVALRVPDLAALQAHHEALKTRNAGEVTVHDRLYFASLYVREPGDALVELATDLKLDFTEPAADDRHGWAKLMKKAGVKGIHIAERDTQRAKEPKPFNTFWNTWSVEGFIAEGLQPAELGWGSHEKWMPKNARKQKKGNKAAIFLEQPGGNTRIRTWCPTLGAQYGLLVTHNEAISIADFFTLRDKKGKLDFRLTCHYAYHPSNDAILALDEMFGAGGKAQPVQHVLEEHEILDGSDELGVLLYGHDKNAYWYGSQLTVEEARKLAPYQNATGLQVSSAVLAGMVWALENPQSGIVETDEMDYRRCLEVQMQYLGPVKGYYTDWTPLEGRGHLFKEDLDTKDPWQFRNILVR